MKALVKKALDYLSKEFEKEDNQQYVQEHFVVPITNYVLEKIYPYIIIGITVIILIIILIVSILLLLLTRGPIIAH